MIILADSTAITILRVNQIIMAKAPGGFLRQLKRQKQKEINLLEDESIVQSPNRSENFDDSNPESRTRTQNQNHHRMSIINFIQITVLLISLIQDSLMFYFLQLLMRLSI